MSKDSLTHCLNCGQTFQGNYCPNCGQAAKTHRIYFKEIFTTLAEVILHGESKFLVTCKGLLLSPGIIAKEYILGRRQKYYKPLQLLFFLVAVYTFISLLKEDLISPFNLIDIEKNMGDGIPYSGSPALNSIFSVYFTLMHNKVYSALFSIVFNMVPYKLFFRKYPVKRLDGSSEPLNLAEHFFALVYLACINMLMAYIALPFMFIPECDTIIRLIFLVVPTFICICMYKQICSISWARSTFLNISATITSIAVSIILLTFFFGLVCGIENVVKS